MPKTMNTLKPKPLTKPPRRTATAATAAIAATAATAATAPIDLALQGGGSHGAFTWGVLDRLLEDDTLALAGISGTSAGALNAAVLATGWARGGRSGARAALRAFWMDVARDGGPSSGCFGALIDAPLQAPLQAHLQAHLQAQLQAAMAGAPALGRFNLDMNPFYAWAAPWLRFFSPYQFGTQSTNPLRTVLERHVDPQQLAEGPLNVFVIATSVRTGQPRVFDRSDLSIDALLASACLPQLFRAVVIDGEPYWDGGYSGNPALWPLIYNTDALDLLLVKINPLMRPDTPQSPDDIADRINEITFNAGLVGEMRAIGFVQRLIEEGVALPDGYKHLRLHMVADDAGLAPLNASSKLNTARAFLEALHTLGRAAADRWWQAHRADVGRRSSLDLAATFLTPRRAPPAA